MVNRGFVVLVIPGV